MSLSQSLRLLKAEAAARIGRLDEAGSLIHEAAGLDEEPTLDQLAEVQRVAAVATALDGQPTRARAHFARAATLLEASGNRTARREVLRQQSDLLGSPSAGTGCERERVHAAAPDTTASRPHSAADRPTPSPEAPRLGTAPGDAMSSISLDRPAHIEPGTGPPVTNGTPDPPDARVGAQAAPSAEPDRSADDAFDRLPDVVAARTAALADLGGFPQLLGRELAALLDLTGTVRETVVTATSDTATAILATTGCSEARARQLAAATQPGLRLELGPWHRGRVTLTATPVENPGSRATLAALQRLANTARWVHETRRAERERDALWPIDPRESDEPEIFVNEYMVELSRLARRVATSPFPVLVTGETGTGKEVFARLIHRASNRAERPFVPFNCTAVPHDMIDSQLFGYRRGAFTGATADFPGVIRSTSGGTLFLDEIGDMGLDVQPKLLRFLESGEVHPLGETRPSHADVRIIACTNANLDTLVTTGRFREDLFYRINVVRFHLLPLRERREEIPPLVEHFLRRAAEETGKRDITVADETMEYLLIYRWPGNVRQLANEMRRLVAFAEPGAILMPEHLDLAITEGRRTIPVGQRPPLAHEVLVRLDQPLPAAVEHLERAAIQRAIRETNGQLDEAARRLGLSRKGLYLKRRRLGIGFAADGTPTRPAAADPGAATDEGDDEPGEPLDDGDTRVGAQDADTRVPGRDGERTQTGDPGKVTAGDDLDALGVWDAGRPEAEGPGPDDLG